MRLAEELRTVREPKVTDGVPDYSPAAVARWQQGLASLKARHAAFDTKGWPVADRVDHVLVGTMLDAFDFDLRVSKPWQRDPGHWVDLIARTPYVATPVGAADRARVVAELKAVPRILAEARTRLTRPSGELAGIALFHLEQSDGVNQGEPRRDPPPAGVIGWYQELLARAKAGDQALVPDVQAALTAVTAFRDWLRSAQPLMREPAFVGLEHYIWFVRHVRLVNLTTDQVRMIGERELERARTLLAIERNRNLNLPELVPVTNAQEHERRTREAETLIRAFTAREQLLTIPADIPATYETDAFFINREAWGGHRHFWEEITYRDPLNNHIHASIPGHRFDGTLQRRNPRPIRRMVSDGTRAEGWGFYIEEMYLQAGLLNDRPRTRELFYIAQLKRAARVHAEQLMQTGAFTLKDAIAYLVGEVPLMEENLARYDLAIYLRRPAYGMNYTIGKTQMERLVADRSRQLGSAFRLGAFHDEFLSKGMIPISLIRWEMTGLDDEMKALGVIK
ncbi:MAG: DUF885 family protein [Gemmatimonadetes bacterium]|nr:DUF885 family protein [Gemmatimonadota bacterium]